MIELIWLSEAKNSPDRAIIPHYRMARRGSMIDHRRINSGIIFTIKMACDGVTRLQLTARTRQSTASSSAEDIWLCLTRSFQPWPPMATRRTNS